jgi:hypothetical protein
MIFLNADVELAAIEQRHAMFVDVARSMRRRSKIAPLSVALRVASKLLSEALLQPLAALLDLNLNVARFDEALFGQ